MFTAARTQIDDPIDRFQHIHVVFNDHNGMPFFDKAMQGKEQFSNVIEMKTGCGLIKDEENFITTVFQAEIVCQLQTLRFPT